jgi:hypothetical protein
MRKNRLVLEIIEDILFFLIIGALFLLWIYE